MMADPVFVGRNRELSYLQENLECMLHGKGVAVFVSGVAGSGKTRLTNEFLKLAKEKGVAILFGWCLSNSNVPYFPFIEAFSSYHSAEGEKGSAPDLSYAAQKMVAYLSEPLGLETVENKPSVPRVWKDRAFLAVFNELLFLSSAKPLLLVLEDMHWADTASLALLHYLSRSVASERIMILGTFRNEELSGEEGPLPLSRTLHLMNREALFSEIKLANLTFEDVGKIAESMLGGSVDSSIAQSMLDQGQGSPFFVVESLHMLAESGCLVKEQGVWRVKGKIGIPYKVREVILRRLEGLRPEERRILDVASVIGDKFDACLIGSVLSIDSLVVLETLNKMFHTTLLLRVEDNAYTFDHALSRDVLYQEISQPLRVGYHERIAEKMENNHDSKSLCVNQLVYHYIHGGNNTKAVEYSLVAGKDALERYSNLEAIKHYSWVLQSISDSPEELEVKRKALIGLGDAFFANNAFKDAVSTYESLAAISLGSIRQSALVKAMSAAFFQGDIQHLDCLHKEAEKEGVLARLERARILLHKASVATMLHGEILEAIKTCEAALAIFEEEYSLPDVAWLLFVVGDFVSGQGKMEKGIAYSLRSLAIYDELGDLRSKMEACNESGKVFFYCGLCPEAQRLFESVLAIEQQTRMGNYLMIAKAHSFLSLIREVAGDVNGAIEENLSAIDYSQKANSSLFLVMIYSNLVKQLVRSGDLSRAVAYDEKLKSIYNQSETEKGTIASFYYTLAEAVLLAGKGDYKRSLEEFDKYLTRFRKKFSNPQLMSHPLSYYAWVLELSGERKRSSEIKDEILKTFLENNRRFEKPNVMAYFTVPTEVFEGEVFRGRLDVVNVSRSSCSVGVHTTIPLEFVLVNSLQRLENDPGVFGLEDWLINPFNVKTIPLVLRAKRTGNFTISSTIKYKDELKNIKTCEPKPVSITVRPSTKLGSLTQIIADGKSESKIMDEKQVEELFVFGSDVAKRVFNFLANEFIRDYMQRRLFVEKAGWRTLVEIAQGQKISKSGLYRNRRRALGELERRGLVEARFFPGERGRGGKILRLRVSYDKESVKHYVDCLIRNGKKQ